MKTNHLHFIFLLLFAPFLYLGCSDDVDPDPYGITTDTDGDGIPDVSDRCPDSPSGTVDDFGCPVGSGYTYVPDDDFEQILIDQGFDLHLDDYVLTNSIKGITELELPRFADLDRVYSLKDLTGIEDFEALEKLTLIYGDFGENSIDLSRNTNLNELLIICSSIDNLDLSQTNIESIHIRGNLFFERCTGRIGDLNLEGLETLRSFYAYFVEFDNLNSILNSAPSLQEIVLTDPMDPNGSLDYLDLSANENLTNISIYACSAEGPGIINLKNGANPNLSEIILGAGSDLCIPQEAFSWEPCIEVDDPTFIESVIRIPEYSYPLLYSVTTNCGG